MSTIKGAYAIPNDKSSSMVTRGPYGLDGALTSRTKVFTKSTDMIKFDEDEGDGGGEGGDEDNTEVIDSHGDTYRKHRVDGHGDKLTDRGDGSYHNVLSLYVHPDSDGDNDIIDELAESQGAKFCQY